MERRSLYLLAVAPALALIAALVLAFAPVYSDGNGLVEAEGAWTLLLLAILVAVTTTPLRSPPGTQAAVATVVGVVIVVFSFISVIGVWFLPAAAALLVASWFAPGRSG